MTGATMPSQATTKAVPEAHSQDYAHKTNGSGFVQLVRLTQAPDTPEKLDPLR
jgi:hypothetical protein